MATLVGDAASGYKEVAVAGERKATQYRLARLLLRVGGPVGLGELTEAFGGWQTWTLFTDNM